MTPTLFVGGVCESSYAASPQQQPECAVVRNKKPLAMFQWQHVRLQGVRSRDLWAESKSLRHHLHRYYHCHILQPETP